MPPHKLCLTQAWGHQPETPPSREGEAVSTHSPLPGRHRESGREVSPTPLPELPLKPPPGLERRACHLEAGALGRCANLKEPKSGRPVPVLPELNRQGKAGREPLPPILLENL